MGTDDAWRMAGVLALLCVFAGAAFALNATLVGPGGTPLSLKYDSESQSYADSGVNPNAFLRLCDPGSLDGKYAGLLYKVGDSYKLVSTPLGGGFGDLMRVSNPPDSLECTDLDVQVSSFRAFYPAWPVAVVSDDAYVSLDDTFVSLSNSTGWMNGSFVLTRNVSGSNVTVNVTSVRAHDGSEITLNRSYLVVGIANSSGDILDSGITGPGSPITLSRGAYSGTPDVVVNGIPTQPNVTPTRPPPPEEGGCTSDYQCPDDYYCLGRTCLQVECRCGEIYAHACHPYSCCSNSDCGTGRMCLNHSCVIIPGRCENDSQCPSGYVCRDGDCVRPPRCLNDGDCPEGYICIDGTCSRPECSSNADCPAGLICANGRCVIAPPECARDSDCSAGFVCRGGKCVVVPPECDSDTDCPAGYVCTAGKCVTRPPECTADADCPAGKICIGGQCRAVLRLEAPAEVELNSQLNVSVLYSDGAPGSFADVEIVYPSGKRIVVTAGVDGKLSLAPEETGIARLTARRMGDVAKGQTLVLPIKFVGTLVGFTINCSDALLYILLIAGLCSLLAWWLIYSRLRGGGQKEQREVRKRRILLWGSWLLVSMALFLLPLFASIMVGPCVVVGWMPLEPLLILLIEIIFLLYDAAKPKGKKPAAAPPAPGKKPVEPPEEEEKDLDYGKEKEEE